MDETTRNAIKAALSKTTTLVLIEAIAEICEELHEEDASIESNGAAWDASARNIRRGIGLCCF